MSYSEAITKESLTNILNQVLPASSGMSVEDISDKITFGSAWSNFHRKAYLIGGKFVFFTLEGYAGTIVAGTQYTIATIASGYRPKDTLMFTGHATNSSYVPQSVVNCYVFTSGDITVRCSNANGNYVFINGWYALAEGSAPIIVADYIVEQGTSGIWTYRKWNSGVAECWGKHSFTITAWAQWASAWETNGTYASYPTSLFISNPQLRCQNLVCSDGSATASLEMYQGASNTRTPSMYLMRHTIGNANVTGYIDIYNGIWLSDIRPYTWIFYRSCYGQ